MPWDLLRLSPGDLKEMLEAVEEDRSLTREWVASLVASIISTCVPEPKRLKKKRMDTEDLLGKGDRIRSAKRHRAAVAADRALAAQQGQLAVVKSADWGEL
jgi:hypothetical protein